MRHLDHLAATTAAALASLTLLSACTNDDSPPESAPYAAGDEPTADSTGAASSYTILGAPHLDGPGRWGVTAFGDPDAPVAVLEVPEGFQGRESWVWTDNQAPGEFAQVSFWSPTRVPKDPCKARASSRPVGPGVEDLAAALAGQRRTTTTKPTSVSLGGHQGLYVELTTPSRFDYEACSPDGMQIWLTERTEPRALDEPVTDRYWIMDVEGQPLVIAAMTLRAATSETVELVTGVVETTAFVSR